jgi:hypothetical protein
MKGSKAKGRGYASKMPDQRGKPLYKVATVRRGVRGPGDHAKTVAMEEPAAGQPVT